MQLKEPSLAFLMPKTANKPAPAPFTLAAALDVTVVLEAEAGSANTFVSEPLLTDAGDPFLVAAEAVEVVMLPVLWQAEAVVLELGQTWLSTQTAN